MERLSLTRPRSTLLLMAHPSHPIQRAPAASPCGSGSSQVFGRLRVTQWDLVDPAMHRTQRNIQLGSDPAHRQAGLP
jgi:hypothetical protein